MPEYNSHDFDFSIKCDKPKYSSDNVFTARLFNKKSERIVLTFANVRMYKNPIVYDDFMEFYLYSNSFLRTFFLQLECAIKELYAPYLEDPNAIKFGNTIRFEGMQEIAQIIVGQNLDHLQNVDVNEHYKIKLQLHSVLQVPNTVKIIWKLKHLEIIEKPKESLKEPEIDDVCLDYEELEQIKTTLSKLLREKRRESEENIKRNEARLEIIKEIEDIIQNNADIEKLDACYEEIIKLE